MQPINDIRFWRLKFALITAATMHVISAFYFNVSPLLPARSVQPDFGQRIS
jgi:hypothetical protein